MSVRCTVLFAIALFSAVSAAAEDEQTGKLLVPVNVGLPLEGAHGSLWETMLVIGNRGTQSFRAEQAPGSHNPVGTPKVLVVPPGTFEPWNLSPTVNGGPAFLYVLPSRQGDLTGSLRIIDRSRHLLTGGTEIPLVWESAVKEGAPVSLVGVPFQPSFRNWLRIYEFGSLDGSAVKVVIHDAEGGVIAEDEVVLRYMEQETNLPPIPPVPAYAAVNLNQLTSVDNEQTRIEVIPITEGLKIWAFVSITHDETQHVTTVTPQP